MPELDDDYTATKRWFARLLRKLLVKLDPTPRAVITVQQVKPKENQS